MSKSKTEPTADTATEPTKVNKTEAVRNALKELGMEAKPLDVQAYVKDRYGVEVPTQVVSNVKFQMGKSNGKAATKPAPKPKLDPQPVPPLPVRPAVPTPTAPVAVGITLLDVAAVRELVNRLGVEQVQKLAEVVS